MGLGVAGGNRWQLLFFHHHHLLLIILLLDVGTLESLDLLSLTLSLLLESLGLVLFVGGMVVSVVPLCILLSLELFKELFVSDKDAIWINCFKEVR